MVLVTILIFVPYAFRLIQLDPVFLISDSLSHPHFFFLFLFSLLVTLVFLKGTTKRKELHGTTYIQALFGNWGEKLGGAIFHAYKFDFPCNIISKVYSGFVLLTESKLDDDVGNVEMDLFLVKKMVKASVSACGLVNLDAEQVST